MSPINGPIDWRPIEEAPSDGTIIYGFFDPYTQDSGLHAHVRPVRRYRDSGDWFCGVTSHNLGTLNGPLLFTDQIPYPTRAQVRAVMQAKLDKDVAEMEARNPDLVAAGHRPTVPPLTF